MTSGSAPDERRGGGSRVSEAWGRVGREKNEGAPNQKVRNRHERGDDGDALEDDHHQERAVGHAGGALVRRRHRLVLPSRTREARSDSDAS